MDGRGRWMDNVFIERLWRSIKYEEIYLREHATVHELEGGVERWMKHYNTWPCAGIAFAARDLKPGSRVTISSSHSVHFLQPDPNGADISPYFNLLALDFQGSTRPLTPLSQCHSSLTPFPPRVGCQKTSLRGSRSEAYAYV